MCIICLELDRDRLTPFEARRNLGEMSSTIEPEHLAEVERRIDEAEKAQAEAE